MPDNDRSSSQPRDHDEDHAKFAEGSEAQMLENEREVRRNEQRQTGNDPEVDPADQERAREQTGPPPSDPE